MSLSAPVMLAQSSAQSGVPSSDGTSSSVHHRKHHKSEAASPTGAAATATDSQSKQQPAEAPSQTQPGQAPPVHGTVLFERKEVAPTQIDDDTPAPPTSPVVPELHRNPAAPPSTAPQPQSTSGVSSSSGVAVGDEEAKRAAAISAIERAAPSITAYDLELHLTQSTGAIIARAQVAVRNDGATAITKLPLQISSALQWQSARLRTGTNTSTPLPMEQHRVDTDTDHTGAASEAVLTLPKPLAHGETIDLDLFYAGALVTSGERLERIGAPAEQANTSDWDGFGTTPAGDSPDITGVRGFGSVLWYPVAEPVAMLGDSNRLFTLINTVRQRQQESRFHLRLVLEFTATSPDAAFFCGRREPLLPLEKNTDETVTESVRVATAEWTLPRLGFRLPSLFLSVPSPTETDGHLIEAVTAHADTVPLYAAAAKRVQPTLQEWLGAAPLESLWLLDLSGNDDARNSATPFQDGALFALPMRAASVEKLSPGMIHALAHTWFHSPSPWMSEGLAQFLYLQWIERSQTRDVALAQLEDSGKTLSLAQTLQGKDDVGEPLITCSSEVCYRTKAAYVFTMLRTLAGEDALKQALQAYRTQITKSSPAISPKDDAIAFERLLEKTSGKDLAWFFDDWVLHDRGLPDLSIVAVTPRPITGQAGAGGTLHKEGGWFVAIEVSNDGGAAAEVPITLRSGALTATESLRVPAHEHATKRMVFESTPEEVIVNDGTTPELRTNTHHRTINATQAR